MALHFVRSLRTPFSERFLIQAEPGKDCGAVELHYLPGERVVGTVIVLDEKIFPEQKIPELLKEIDEFLLPDASIEDGKLHFTVVSGHVVGTFFPHPS
ncbi:MAG TPA: hypothetical protein VGY54_09225 [Polyangiaceae bacterium]|jgi:hypothetical protein|nr:hypothetical protein [Polyangiaceae bacterium]HEV3301583.1 hypothetical protein [Planctomycetaceae bacterium]